MKVISGILSGLVLAAMVLHPIPGEATAGAVGCPPVFAFLVGSMRLNKVTFETVGYAVLPAGISIFGTLESAYYPRPTYVEVSLFTSPTRVLAKRTAEVRWNGEFRVFFPNAQRLAEIQSVLVKALR